MSQAHRGEDKSCFVFFLSKGHDPLLFSLTLIRYTRSFFNMNTDLLPFVKL